MQEFFIAVTFILGYILSAFFMSDFHARLIFKKSFADTIGDEDCVCVVASLLWPLTICLFYPAYFLFPLVRYLLRKRLLCFVAIILIFSAGFYQLAIYHNIPLPVLPYLSINW